MEYAVCGRHQARRCCSCSSIHWNQNMQQPAVAATREKWLWHMCMRSTSPCRGLWLQIYTHYSVCHPLLSQTRPALSCTLLRPAAAPKRVLDQLTSIFPGVGSATDLLVVPTCQQSDVDLVNYGAQADEEKDRLLERVGGRRVWKFGIGGLESVSTCLAEHCSADWAQLVARCMAPCWWVSTGAQQGNGTPCHICMAGGGK